MAGTRPHAIQGSSSLPSQRTRFAQQTRRQAVSDRKGLEQMGSVLSNFFQQTQNATQTIQRTVAKGEMREIEMENEAQAAQAQADFRTGQRDESLSDDLDYTKQWSKMQGERDGRETASDFREWYLKEWAPDNPDGDLNTARDEYFKANLTGYEDDLVQSVAANSFYSATDDLLATHEETRFRRYSLEKTNEAKAAMVADIQRGDFAPEDVLKYQNMVKRLNPLSPGEAPKIVANTIVDFAMQNPKEGQRALQVLKRPGTGVNGKSFQESYPDVMAKLEKQHAQDFGSVNNRVTEEQYDLFEQDLNDWGNLSAEEKASWPVRMLNTVQNMGGKNRYDQLMGTYLKNVRKEDDRLVRAHNFSAALMSDINDFHDILGDNDHLEEYLNKVHGTTNFGEIEASNLGIVFAKQKGSFSTEQKAQMSDMMIKSSSPETQLQAYKIAKQATTMAGYAGYAEGFLSGEALDRFQSMEVVLEGVKAEDHMTVLQEMNKIAQSREMQEMKLGDFFPDTNTSDLRDEVDGIVDDVADAQFDWGWWSSASDNLAPAFRKKLENHFLHIKKASGGQASNTAAMRKAFERMVPSTEIIRTVDSEGEEVVKVHFRDQPMGGRLSHSAINPDTGQPEDTYQTSIEDMGQLQLENPEVFGGLEEDNLFPVRDHMNSERFLVHSPEGPVFLEPNQKITINGERIDLSGSPEEVRDRLAEVGSDDGVGLTYNSLEDAWMMTYLPNFKGTTGKETIEERQRAFKKKSSEYRQGLQEDRNRQLIASAKQNGLISEGVGVNSTMPNFSSTREVLDFISQQKKNARRMGGRSFIDSKTLNAADTYTRRRFQTAKQLGVSFNRRATYASTGNRVRTGDAQGDVKRTVGMGFDLDQQNAKTIVEAALPDVDFDQLRNGNVQLTDQQIMNLYNADIAPVEKRINTLTADADVSDRQQAALVSLSHQYKDDAEFQSALEQGIESLKAGNTNGLYNAVMGQVLGGGKADGVVWHGTGQKPGRETTQADALSLYKQLDTAIDGGLESIGVSAWHFMSQFSEEDNLARRFQSMEKPTRRKTIDGIFSAADALGITPENLAAVISYETAGTFDALQWGMTTNSKGETVRTKTKWGHHRGFIQFGETQASENGVDWDNPVDSQLGPDGAVVKYLRSRGVKPGASLLEIYAAINGGNVTATDVTDEHNGGDEGTVRDKVNTKISGAHMENAMSFLFM